MPATIMQSTMMHMPMTVQMIMDHGRNVFPDSKVGTFDGESMRYSSYGEIADNAARLAASLQSLGIVPADRVATFSWNNTAHMEAYLGIPSMGAIMHTVNIRLSPEHIAYIINHAANRVLLLDVSLIDVFAPVLPLLECIEHILLIGEGDLKTEIATKNYRELLAANEPLQDWPELDETSAAAVCYTSALPATPKGWSTVIAPPLFTRWLHGPQIPLVFLNAIVFCYCQRCFMLTLGAYLIADGSAAVISFCRGRIYRRKRSNR